MNALKRKVEITDQFYVVLSEKIDGLVKKIKQPVLKTKT
jgi:hypothetical protein